MDVALSNRSDEITRAHPAAGEAFSECTRKISVMPIIDYARSTDDKTLLGQIIDGISPDFIVRHFILAKTTAPVKVPDALRDALSPEDISYLQEQSVDTGISQLTLLQAAGYTRWNEIADHPDLKSIDQTQLPVTTVHFLKEVGVLR